MLAQFDFDPTGNNLPKLWDEYDRCGEAYLTAPESDLAKTWSLSQVEERHGPPGFRIRFSIVADWLQIPSVEPYREAEQRKSAPLTASERNDLLRRIDLAKIWLERWAPEDAKFSVRPTMPEVSLTDQQRGYLRAVRDLVGTITDPDVMQNELYEVAKRVGLVQNDKVSRDAFASIYLAFLGKPNGPKAAWLITTLDPNFVRRRLDEASGAVAHA